MCSSQELKSYCVFFHYSYTGFPELKVELFPQKAPVNPLIAGLKVGTPCPNSPMTRRTKQEMRSALKIAQRQANTPILWAKWVLQCSSFIISGANLAFDKPKGLSIASLVDWCTHWVASVISWCIALHIVCVQVSLVALLQCVVHSPAVLCENGALQG